MIPLPPSGGFFIMYRFNIKLDDKPEALWLKLERYANTRFNPAYRTVLLFLAVLLKEWWINIKTHKTMADVDRQIEEFHRQEDISSALRENPTYKIEKDCASSSEAAKEFGFESMSLTAPHVKKSK